MMVRKFSPVTRLIIHPKAYRRNSPARILLGLLRQGALPDVREKGLQHNFERLKAIGTILELAQIVLQKRLSRNEIFLWDTGGTATP